MSGCHRLGLIFFLPGLLALSSPHAWSQLVLGQYEDEAPFRTWNTYGGVTAPYLGLGGASLAYAADVSAALSNPALLLKLPRACFSVDGSFNHATFFKYALVNTGVLASAGNLSANFWALDSAGFSLRIKDWAFALVANLAESYDRPAVDYSFSSEGSLLYKLSFDQKGTLRNFHFSVARRLFDRLCAGLGVNVLRGDFNRDTLEHWTTGDIQINDRKTQAYSGFNLNVGLTYELTDGLTAALVFRPPFTKKAKSQSLLEYLAPKGQADIRIEASSEDSYKQPLIIGAGADWRITTGLRVVSDLAFYNWSHYRVNYFGEEVQREFRDIVQIRAGVEYLAAHNIFGRPAKIPLRFGIQYDPQPMKAPHSSYFYYSIGTGIQSGRFQLDAAAFFGKESGSGNSLSGQRIAVSLSYKI